MSDAYLGEIRLLPYTFAPDQWASCDGQILPISRWSALFSVIGTMYGGDGRVTFQLPNLNGRLAMGAGQGPDLSPRYVGEEVGEAAVKLEVEQLPPHVHLVQGTPFPANDHGPGEHNVLAKSVDGNAYGPFEQQLVPMAAQGVGATGGGEPHDNLMPSLGVRYCIALAGVFPPRP